MLYRMHSNVKKSRTTAVSPFARLHFCRRLHRHKYETGSKYKMRRRSTRQKVIPSLKLPPNVLLGISSLIEGNEVIICSMLSVGKESDPVEKLVSTMAINSLSAEALLARFFDASMLSEYCETRLGKSGKGGTAVLAARIAREWNKSGFSPLTLKTESAEVGSTIDATSSSVVSGKRKRGNDFETKAESCRSIKLQRISMMTEALNSFIGCITNELYPVKVDSVWLKLVSQNPLVVNCYLSCLAQLQYLRGNCAKQMLSSCIQSILLTIVMDAQKLVTLF